MPKIKNIIIFVVIAAVFILIYVFYIKPTFFGGAPALSTTTPSATDTTGTTATGASVVPDNFLTLLLSVNNIKLNDAIFSDPAFIGLRDSSITLIPDTTIGRPNPFAPIGSDVVPPPASSTTTTTISTPPITPTTSTTTTTSATKPPLTP